MATSDALPNDGHMEKMPMDSWPDNPSNSDKLRLLVSYLQLSPPKDIHGSSRRFLRALAPSFLIRKDPEEAAASAKKPVKISTLDGLRGLACLFVFNEHFTYNFPSPFLLGYGVDGHKALIQWPGIRMLWSGFLMVSIFFVISGYVLSYKPRQLMRQQKLQEFQKTLTSSVFRRAIRLFLPPMIATWITGLLCWLHVFEPSRRVWESAIVPLHEYPPPMFNGLWLNLKTSFLYSTNLLVIWDWNNDSQSTGDYDGHTWTMPVEFRCSMALFLLLVGAARLRQNVRLISIFSFILYCIWSDRKHVTLFAAGMLIAELDMIRQEKQTSSKLPLHSISALNVSTRTTQWIWLTVFAFGVYFASAPVLGCDITPGYVHLLKVVPYTVADKPWYLRSVGAILITWSAKNSETLRPVFNNPFSVYLGKISFALYLVHGNVLKSLLHACIPMLYQATGINPADLGAASTRQIIGSWFLGLLLVMPITIWIADLFWRWVDDPCVKFARWVESKMSTKETTESPTRSAPMREGR